MSEKVNLNGNEIDQRTDIFSVEGLHCTSCVARVEKVIKNRAGVESAVVNLAEMTATVKYIDSIISSQQIISTIRESGYNASIRTDNSKTDENIKAQNNLLTNLKIALPLTIVILFISHLHMFGLTLLDDRLTYYLLFFLTLPVQFYCGRMFFGGFRTGLKSKAANMDTLVVVGTSAAFLYSTVATFAPGLLIKSGQTLAVYYDTAAMIITVILFGRYLENRARKSTTKEINKLIKMEQRTAHVLRDGNEIQISASDIVKGEIVIVKPGGRVPVDGIVTDGHSSVDESMLTGEPLAREITVGDKIISGSINKTGLLKFRAEAVGSETVLNQIIQAVRQIISSKANIQKLADKVASYFVPAVITLAVISFLLWTLLPDKPDFAFSLMIFISVLIIACPCALGLATPTAIIVGSARGAREGILIKSAQILESVKRIDTVVFDKTGTLSTGKPRVMRFVNLGRDEDRIILEYTASVEKGSEHPLAEAILRFTENKEITTREISGFEYFPGLGIKAKVNSKTVCLGNSRYFKREGLSTDEAEKYLQEANLRGQTSLLLAVESQLEAVFLIGDQIKPEASMAVQELLDCGHEIYLLSGDTKAASDSIAKQLGIKSVIAEVLPQEKSSKIKSLKDSGKTVAMVGDGINDAPALAEADIGIAMGSGSDAAVSFSDITLLGSNLTGVSKALKLSERTLKTIKQNLWWAFGYNIIAIPLAAGLFYKSAGILLSPVIASAAMALSSIFVVTNSLRLRKLNL